MFRTIFILIGTLLATVGTELGRRRRNRGGVDPDANLQLLCIDTAAATSQLSIGTPDGGSYTLPPDGVHIIRARSKAEMVRAVGNYPSTAFFRRRLEPLPDTFNTGDGAGAMLVTSFLAGEMDSELTPAIERKMLLASDENAVRRAVEGGTIGKSFTGGINIEWGINGGGGTQGILLAAAIRAQRFAAARGIAITQRLLAIDPNLSGDTGSVARADAERNFICNQRLCHRAVVDWRNFQIPTFSGPLKPIGPLFDQIQFYQPANEIVTVADRADAARDIARLLDVLASNYTTTADAAFHDGRKDTIHQGTPLPYSSGGLWLRRLDPLRTRQIAVAAAARRIAQEVSGA